MVPCSNKPQPSAPSHVARRHVVDHAERDAGDDGGVGQVVLRALDEAAAAPLPVRPVGVAAVAGTDVEHDRTRASRPRCRTACRRARRCSTARSGWRVPDRYWISTSGQPSCSTRPSPQMRAGVVERAEAVRQLLGDHDDGEVVEPQRHVQPPEALERLVGVATGRLGLADRPDAPRPVTGADPAVGDTTCSSPPTSSTPSHVPTCANREASRIARAPGPHDVVLLHRPRRTSPPR